VHTAPNNPEQGYSRALDTHGEPGTDDRKSLIASLAQSGEDASCSGERDKGIEAALAALCPGFLLASMVLWKQMDFLVRGGKHMEIICPGHAFNDRLHEVAVGPAVIGEEEFP
jgi:hypothetical protein